MNKRRLLLSLWLLLIASFVWAQNTVTGRVLDSQALPLPGVNVFVKGTTNGTITDMDGKFRLDAVNPNSTLVLSFIGFDTKELKIGQQTSFNVTLVESANMMTDVVVVGYGTQKKESVVGAIAQAKGDELMKSGGVTTVGQALAGKIAGVTVLSSTGKPGEENPDIYIRARATWSGSGQPLVMIDGVARSLNEIDNSDIESISILKDASATAVFGVQGANGVILITTKRGKEGKSQLSVGFNSTFKFPGKLPTKLESYEGIMVMNEAIERTMPYESDGWEGWKDYVPMDIANKYRNPADVDESYRYPNVDWTDVLMKDYALDHHLNLSVRGGTEKTKYYGSLNYTHTGDIFDGHGIENDRTYKADFRYDRFNYRTNVDFDLTKITRFSVNLSGMYGVQQSNDFESRLDKFAYGSIYKLAPSVYYPKYDDGLWGKHPEETFDIRNPALLLVASGSYANHRVQVNADFVLDQKLDFITDGLSFKGTFAYDNKFVGQKGIIEPLFAGNQNNAIVRMINRNDGSETIASPPGVNQFDFVLAPWTLSPMRINDSKLYRKKYYQLALNYAKKFGAHNVTALALMSREAYAEGSSFATYREDWVGRVTYDYATKYFLDVNGAYNGSQKFGPGYKFDFFPSAAVGWMISNESFMDGTSGWLNMMKIRGSYGYVGDDQGGGSYAYTSQWESSGKIYMDSTRPWNGFSPYTTYREKSVGNPMLRWEEAQKMNAGLELGLFESLLSFTMDYYTEYRYDIIVKGKDRTMPPFIGIAAPDANVGETKVHGFEFSGKVNWQVNGDLNLNASGFFTSAKDEILYKEEPELKDAYQKQEGSAIEQPRVQLPSSMMTSWDDVYMASRQEGGLKGTRPGYYGVKDFNGDGVIDSKDYVPYSYPIRPKNTWNSTIGADYKNWSFMIQFYGAFNAFKEYGTNTFTANTPLFFEHMTDYWSVENQNGTKILPSWKGVGSTDPMRNWYDASYIKLQNIELSYKLKDKVGSQYRFFVNGNDLYTWSYLPDERQKNDSNVGNDMGYPMFKRVNVGISVNF